MGGQGKRHNIAPPAKARKAVWRPMYNRAAVGVHMSAAQPVCQFSGITRLSTCSPEQMEQTACYKVLGRGMLHVLCRLVSSNGQLLSILFQQTAPSVASLNAFYNG